MAKGKGSVPRPVKKTEYTIQFATQQAQKGWTDLVGTTRNAIVDAWDFLTRTPMASSDRNHQLKGELATVAVAGTRHDGGSTSCPVALACGATSRAAQCG